jgi:uncharacterized protein (DUF1800 family)
VLIFKNITMATNNRRGFFEGIFGRESVSNRLEIASTLDEYTQPLTRLQVRHLLRRATFGLSIELIDRFEGKTAGELVEYLFATADKTTNPSPLPFINESVRNPKALNGSQKEIETKKYDKHVGDYNYDLGEWWVKLMQNDSGSILEKMVLFWHDHFATQFASCDSIPATMMYNQNDLFRKNYAGNFRTLLEKISIDGAMLRYLNGNLNMSDSPNENYARELLELFAIGVGNYTEQDIREAAKVLTGWKITMFTDEGTPYVASLTASQFDKNSKKFMDEVITVNYEINQQNVYENSVKKLISIILNKKGKEAARFISDKIYTYFVYSNPEKVDKSIINALASLLQENNFEFKPVLKKLLKSQHFFDELNIGVQIKSPAECIIGVTRHLQHNNRYTRNIMAALGLELFNPPNVAGWKGYRSWISTKTLPLTIFYLNEEIVRGQTNDKLHSWIKTFANYDDPKKLTEKICELFLVKPLNAERLSKFTNALLGGAPEYEWYEISKQKDAAGQKLRGLIKEITKAPDYYLI